ncbi:MAG: TRAP transporter large permease subunit, partial [Pseudomonadota bacterium]|nr:TRAP transporter large permease subunit [Pseudomonadota bacterium]
QARRRVAGPAVDRRGQGLLGLIHPPVGMVVFVVKSVVQEVSFTTIFKGVLPFVVTDILRLVILISFPAIALWLPGRMG